MTQMKFKNTAIIIAASPNNSKYCVNRFWLIFLRSLVGYWFSIFYFIELKTF